MKKIITALAIAGMFASSVATASVRPSASIPQAQPAGQSLAVPAGTRMGPAMNGKNDLLGSPAAIAFFIAGLALAGWIIWEIADGDDGGSASPF